LRSPSVTRRDALAAVHDEHGQLLPSRNSAVSGTSTRRPFREHDARVDLKTVRERAHSSAGSRCR